MKAAANIITFQAVYSIQTNCEAKHEFLPLNIYKLQENYILHTLTLQHSTPAIAAQHTPAPLRENFEIAV